MKEREATHVSGSFLEEVGEATAVGEVARIYDEIRATNVFMNGIPGPGPMGFQPSVFDFDAGDAQWSPYWDHFTYAWTDEAEARLLTTEDEIHAARNAGELDEFPGHARHERDGLHRELPVPVLAPPTFSA